MSSQLLRVVLLGSPGSGKGTVAARISKDFHMFHFSSGNLFRAHIRHETCRLILTVALFLLILNFFIAIFWFFTSGNLFRAHMRHETCRLILAVALFFLFLIFFINIFSLFLFFSCSFLIYF